MPIENTFTQEKLWYWEQALAGIYLLKIKRAMNNVSSLFKVNKKAPEQISHIILVFSSLTSHKWTPAGSDLHCYDLLRLKTNLEKVLGITGEKGEYLLYSVTWK